LIREAQEYDADAIVGLDFEVDGVKRADFDGTHLQRIAATALRSSSLKPRERPSEKSGHSFR